MNAYAWFIRPKAKTADLVSRYAGRSSSTMSGRSRVAAVPALSAVSICA